MKFLFLLTFLFVYSQCVFAKIFTQCDLAKELKNHGIPVDKIPSWICMANGESSRNTKAKGGPNKNGSYDWGIFQINDKWWCKPGSPGRGCNVKCEDLRTDDITKAIKCAKIIYKRQGFNAWYGWRKHCKTTLPDLTKCY